MDIVHISMAEFRIFCIQSGHQVHKAKFLYLKTVPSWNRKWKMEWPLPVVIPTQKSTDFKEIKKSLFYYLFKFKAK